MEDTLSKSVQDETSPLVSVGETSDSPEDHRVDNSGEREFGGAVGVSCMMIGFPLLMYYMWIGATFYSGHLPSRSPWQNWSAFLSHLEVFATNMPSLISKPGRSTGHSSSSKVLAISTCLVSTVRAKDYPVSVASNWNTTAQQYAVGTPPSSSPLPSTFLVSFLSTLLSKNSAPS